MMNKEEMFEKFMAEFSAGLQNNLNENESNSPDIIICPKEFKNIKNKWKIFLAGPIQGAPDWQFDMPYIDNVVWLSPRRKSNDKTLFVYEDQVAWETKGLRMSDVILFWIPEPAEDIEGRSYAQTTRFELGENIARGKKIIIGGYKDFPGMKYFKEKAKSYNNILGIYDNLDDCLNCLKKYIKDCKKSTTTYFTSDNHFSSERTLELSKRPFNSIDDMDWTMIEKWNQKVHPNDKVFCLGDFGEEWPLQYLNGNITFIYGNYERDGKNEVIRKNFEEVNKKPIIWEDYFLCHEPITGKKYLKRHDDAKFCLFGHIHGRQKIKEFGIDVGVDCNNYEPMSLEEVKFFRNAIKKGFYDDEVFS